MIFLCLIFPSLNIQIKNLHDKNSDGIPMVMVLGALACGCSWLIYGLMLNDPNVYVSLASARLGQFQKNLNSGIYLKHGERQMLPW